MSAIKAEYYNFKLVKSRKAVQIILETDQANLPEIFSVIGYPEEGKWLGVALLVQKRTSPIINELYERRDEDQVGE